MLEYIVSLIENHVRELNPVKIHLEHQLTLKPEERIIQDPPEEIEKHLISLKLELKNAEKALEYCKTKMNDIPQMG